MKKDSGTTRRQFLQGSAAFLAAWWLGGCSPKAPEPGTGVAADAIAADRYDGFFSVRQAAEEIGHHYIEDYPAEAREDVLTDLIEQSLGAEGSQASTEQAQLGDQLRRVIRADFKAGRVAVLDGWLLSLTEVRLCALMALRAG